MSKTDAPTSVEAVYRTDKRRVLATLIRLLGGFDAAEEALHEAFAAAASQWPRDGVPENPYAWLVSVGKFKTIDKWRRQAKLTDALPDLAARMEDDQEREPAMPDLIQDDELRLIFTCCHPGLPADARIALTLREVGGLTTEEIARAYLSTPQTIAQRIVRAKAKIRDEALPYEVPSRAEWPYRIASVLKVVYLIFNEGYAATEGPQLLRSDLCAEAIRLGRLLAGLSDEPEARGLLALMLLHEARKHTRVDKAGDFILLEDQDRSRWDQHLINEARALIDQAYMDKQVGSYLLQASIAAAHATSPSMGETNWDEIVALYDVLLRVEHSPVVALNRGIALAERDGPEVGLAAIETVMAQGELDRYHLAHAARADILRKLNRNEEARISYQHALERAMHPAERRFLASRIDRLPVANIN